MTDTREGLAKEISLGVRRRRLERAGMREEISKPVVPFAELPDGDRQTWLDCADAALELLGPVTSEEAALGALEAVAAWAHEQPEATADGDTTGKTAQRGRVVATRVLDEGTLGISTYETAYDAAAKTAKMEERYREWLKLGGVHVRGESRQAEEKLGIPADFGGLVGFWLDGKHALVARVGHGRIIEAMRLTPLNAIQLERNVHFLVERGKAEGHITDEHERQAAQLPPMPVEEYDPDYVHRTTGGT